MADERLPAVTEGEEFPLTPEAEYVLELRELDLNFVYDGEKRAQWRFVIVEALDGGPDAAEQVGEVYSVLTSIGMSERHKMFEYTQALLGRKLKVGERPSKSEILDRRVRAYIEHYTKSMGPNVGKRGDRIKLMRPYQTAASVEEPDDDDAGDGDYAARFEYFRMALIDAETSRVLYDVRAEMNEAGLSSDPELVELFNDRKKQLGAPARAAADDA